MMRVINPGVLLPLVVSLTISTSVSATEDQAAALASSELQAGVQLNDLPSKQTAPTVQPNHHRIFPQSEILDHYGLVKEIEKDKVSVRLLNGDIRTYIFASNNVDAGLSSGRLVGFKTNHQGEITKLSPPQVRKIYSGTLIIVEGQKLGMVTPQGERYITTLSEGKISRMGLAPGQPIKITQYQGTWATKVCQPEAIHDNESYPIIAEQKPRSLDGPSAP